MDGYTIAYDPALCDQVWALRRLPSHASLRAAPTMAMQRLLTSLLGLADTENPLRWLCDQHPSECALIARDYATRLALDLLEAVRAWPFGSGDQRLPRLLGPLFTPGAARPFPARWSLDRPSEEATATLVSIRHASGLPPNPAPGFSAGRLSLQCLLADLLRLPDEVDPVAWLVAARPDECAWVALRTLIRAAEPPRPVLGATPLVSPPRRLRTSLRSASGLRVKVEYLAMHEACCELRLRVMFPMAGIPRDAHPWWPGFTRVSDERGDRYLVQVGEWSTSSGLRHMHERLPLFAYPAPLQGRILTWAALPAVLTYERLLPDVSEVVPYGGRAMGSLEWTAPEA